MKIERGGKMDYSCQYDELTIQLNSYIYIYIYDMYMPFSPLWRKQVAVAVRARQSYRELDQLYHLISPTRVCVHEKDCGVSCNAQVRGEAVLPSTSHLALSYLLPLEYHQSAEGTKLVCMELMLSTHSRHFV